ncbi:MAG TPA: hypothetical protein VG223_02310 [Solirubrobacteraceae bacterium]|jgi:hypothetical protein|nr:hypothetical protein [Solirubrobacteraceae bacterium]
MSAVRFDHIVGLWEDGQRRLKESSQDLRPELEIVIDAIVEELRRRLGGAFTSQELADLYIRDGTDWCFDVAMRAAPGTPEAWDLATTANAAFARYVRGAIDWGGGARRATDPDAA